MRALGDGLLSARRHYFGIRIDTLLSVALLEAGEPIQAVEVLQNVVKLAAPAGVYRTILDSGPQIGLLLPRLKENVERKAESKQLLPYIDHLLQGWGELYKSDPAQAPGRATAESLTPRERGILELVAEGHSNREIGELLKAGRIRPVIDKVFPFEQAKPALASQREGRCPDEVTVSTEQAAMPS